MDTSTDEDLEILQEIFNMYMKAMDTCALTKQMDGVVSLIVRRNKDILEELRDKNRMVYGDVIRLEENYKKTQALVETIKRIFFFNGSFISNTERDFPTYAVPIDEDE